MKMQSQKFTLTLPLIGSLFLAAAVLWSHEGEDHGTPASTVGGLGPVVLSDQARRDLELMTEEVDLRTIEETTAAYGVIEARPDDVFWASTRVSGRAVAVHFTAGDTVRKGDVLAEVESRQVASTPVRVKVRALIDGTVTERLISVGEPVEPNSVLFRVMRIATVYARLDLFEADAGRVKVGQQARVYPEVTPERVLKGRVVLVGAALEEMTRTLPVWVELANPGRALRPGMRIRGELVTGASRDVISAPRAALLGGSGNLFVFIDKGEYFIGQPVALGRRDRHHVEITEGLLPGDLVVTQGAYQLQFAAVAAGIETADTAEATESPASPTEQAASTGPPAAAGVRLSELALSNLGLVIEEVDFRILDRIVRCFGFVEPLPAFVHHISTRIAGRVVAGNVVAGQRVRKGQVLAKIESLRIADPPPIVDVPSTLTGVVLERHVFLGEPVDPNKSLFTIVELGEVLVKCHVYEANLAALRVGQAVRIRTEAYPERVFTGRLAYFGGRIDPETRTLAAFVRVKNPAGLLRPNMRAEAHFVTGQGDEAIAIAPSAVLDANGERPFVFVRVGDVFKRQPVILGQRDDRYAEIIDGLLPGDLVVVEGARGLEFATDSPQAPEAPQEDSVTADLPIAGEPSRETRGKDSPSR